MKRCKCGCGAVIKGHPNKKFFNQKHKDRFWNRENPRGKFAYLKRETDYCHPLDSEALGQD
jgi:hypothetical protein